MFLLFCGWVLFCISVCLLFFPTVFWEDTASEFGCICQIICTAYYPDINLLTENYHADEPVLFSPMPKAKMAVSWESFSVAVAAFPINPAPQSTAVVPWAEGNFLPVTPRTGSVHSASIQWSKGQRFSSHSVTTHKRQPMLQWNATV